MKLNEIRDNEGAHKRRIRVGRGIGSSKGKTAGRGGKGQTARTGVRINGFEGGQTPLHRRLPKRGFNQPNRQEYQVINIGLIQAALEAGRLTKGQPITEETLRSSGLIERACDGIRLLADGEIKEKIIITVTAASAAAVKAVEKAGGQVTQTRAAA